MGGGLNEIITEYKWLMTDINGWKQIWKRLSLLWVKTDHTYTYATISMYIKLNKEYEILYSTKIPIQENMRENVACKVTVILFRPQCVIAVTQSTLAGSKWVEALMESSSNTNGW